MDVPHSCSGLWPHDDCWQCRRSRLSEKDKETGQITRAALEDLVGHIDGLTMDWNNGDPVFYRNSIPVKPLTVPKPNEGKARAAAFDGKMREWLKGKKARDEDIAAAEELLTGTRFKLEDPE